MPAIQTVYTDAPVKGFPGQVRNGETSNRISRTVEDAAGLAFGAPAFRGAGDHGVTGTPSAAFMGWVIADHGEQVMPGGTADTVAQYNTAALMTLGSIFVTAGVAVADGEQVYVTAGKVITNVAAGNTIIAGWFFDETIAAAGIVGVVRR